MAQIFEPWVCRVKETLSAWGYAATLAAKIGKGSSKDDRCQLLAPKHWLEAIDPFHRYGRNLNLYYNVWSNSESPDPFFDWLDYGDGKQIDLQRCPRTQLQRQRVRYLGHREREAYEVIVEGGKLLYKESGSFVHTTEGERWIYVLSTSKSLFVGQKKRGFFHHSSFLAGAATSAAGVLVVSNGTLKVLSAQSGHYCPTKENFERLIRFLHEKQVDLRDMKVCAQSEISAFASEPLRNY